MAAPRRSKRRRSPLLRDDGAATMTGSATLIAVAGNAFGMVAVSPGTS